MFWRHNLVLLIILLQVGVESEAQVCICEIYPDIPIENSKCCLHEIKIKEKCEKENVECVTRIEKNSLVWKKVKIDKVDKKK